jgi:putative transposase
VTGDMFDAGIEVKFLVRDRDTKYVAAFDDVFRAGCARILRTPFRTPNANAYAERFVRTVRFECLDRLLIVTARHLERILRLDARHCNGHRPHQAIGQEVPGSTSPAADLPCPDRLNRVIRHDRLGGLIHEYECTA